MAGHDALDTAAAHGFAIFEDRVIHKAQPPATAADIAKVEAMIGAAIPPGLRALWETAFGGEVAYDLDVDFDRHVAHFSFGELFYPGSNHYRDLTGWIEHEQMLAHEADEPEGAPLRFLPFGGFEYLDRLYVRLDDEDYGAVYAWMQGLPVAWAMRLHQDSVARIADDVPALFRLLAFRTDPFAPPQPGRYGSGEGLDEAIDAVRGADAALADALTEVARRAVLDWRGGLEAGTLGQDSRLRHLALDEMARSGEVALVARLEAAGGDPGERYSGGGNLLDHALLFGQDALADVLIARGVDASNTLEVAGSTVDEARAVQLLGLGARPSALAAGRAAAYGRNATARHIVDALLAVDRAAVAAMPDDLEQSAQREDTVAGRVERKEMGSSESAEQIRQRAVDYRALAHYVTERLADGAA